jgi:hypothetical protein
MVKLKESPLRKDLRGRADCQAGSTLPGVETVVPELDRLKSC